VDAVDAYETSTDKVFNKGKMDNFATYLHNEFYLFDSKIKLTGGIRFDYARFYDGAYYLEGQTNATSILEVLENPVIEEHTWEAFSPKASIQFQPSKNARIYASYGMGFRPPVLDDLCRSGFIRGGFKVGNPYLEPETLNSFEVGGDYRFFDFLTVGVSTYLSKGKDFIYYVATGDSIASGGRLRPIMKKENIAEVSIHGVEFETKADIHKYLSVFANYSFTKPEITKHEELEGMVLAYVPENQVSVGLITRNPIMDVTVFMRYKDKVFADDTNETEIDAFTTIDLKLSKTFFNHYTAAFIVQDLIDKRRFDDIGFLSMGRFINFQLSVNF
jgi:outer membrane receptor protein involved in Fe transport